MKYVLVDTEIVTQDSPVTLWPNSRDTIRFWRSITNHCSIALIGTPLWCIKHTSVAHVSVTVMVGSASEEVLGQYYK